MRVLNKKASAETYWDDLVFLEAALLATPETSALAEPITALIDEGEALFQRRRQVRRGQLQSGARASIAHSLLDLGVRRLHNAALFLAQQDRSRPEFRALFRGTLQDEIRHGLRKQLEQADEMIGRLSNRLLPETFQAEHRDNLQGLKERARGAFEAARAASSLEADLRFDEDQWKDEANAARQTTYGALLQLGATQGQAKEWARAFFEPNSSSSRGKAAGGEPEAPLRRRS
jgi:hypothetical protein